MQGLSKTRVFIATLLLMAGVSACSDDAPDGDPGAVTVALRVLPGIAQPGVDPRDAAAAEQAITAYFSPAQEGREAELQQRSGDVWETVYTQVQAADGHVDFVVPAPAEGATDYRVVAAADGDQPDLVSEPAAADLWGDPDLDEAFDGNRLGKDWSTRGADYNPEGFRMCSKASPDAAVVRNGVLELSVLDDPERTGDVCHATSPDGKPKGRYDFRINGHVSTEGSHEFTFGVAAARIKFQPMQGQHGSLWLQPGFPVGNEDPKTAGAEIDVVEWFGNGARSGGLSSFVYNPTPNGPEKLGGFLEDPDQYLSSPEDGWSDAYHVFSVEWTPDNYVFRIDGQVTWQTDQGVSHVPQFPILSLLSSDYELDKLKSDRHLPQTMSVDWIRVWEGNYPSGDESAEASQPGSSPVS